ncbi:MAG: beta-lactamase family protein [Lachnospiraceae bacterium]|nr:beta-lactamase family protein [Lachnospiraceae bacterium]
MKKIRRIMVVCIIGVMMFQRLCVTSYASERSTEDKVAPSGIEYNDIQTTIEKYVEEHNETTAGVGIAIYDENDTIYRNDFGYANKQNSQKVDKHTVFEWGSTSKLFIWVSVMQLVEQGKLNLKEDIRNYLWDGFLANLAYNKEITMLNLMNHQAGFQEMYAGVQISNENEVHSLEETLSTHQPKQIYEPGTVTAYSNWGAALATYIVQRVSGMDYTERNFSKRRLERFKTKNNSLICCHWSFLFALLGIYRLVKCSILEYRRWWLHYG